MHKIQWAITLFQLLQNPPQHHQTNATSDAFSPINHLSLDNNTSCTYSKTWSNNGRTENGQSKVTSNFADTWLSNSQTFHNAWTSTICKNIRIDSVQLKIKLHEKVKLHIDMYQRARTVASPFCKIKLRQKDTGSSND